MHVSTLDNALWQVGFAATILLFVVVVWKRRISQFPFFSAFILFILLRTMALLLINKFEPRDYFYTYWCLAAVDAAFQLLVCGEITWKIFRPTGEWSPGVRRPLFVILAASALIAVVLALLSSPPETVKATRFVIISEFFATTLLAELWAGLMLLSVTSGFVWRSHTGVIARGLGVFNVWSLMVQGVENYIGFHGAIDFSTLLHRTQVVCFILCAGYWTVGLFRPAAVTRRLPQKLEIQLATLDTLLTTTLAQLRSDEVSL